MEIFSSEYLYLLDAAFSSEKYWSAIFSAPALIALLVTICMLAHAGRLFYKVCVAEMEGQSHLSFEVHGMMAISVLVAGFLLVIAHTCAPEMGRVELKREFVAKVYADQFALTLKAHQADESLAYKKLSFGLPGTGDKLTKQFLLFQKALAARTALKGSKYGMQVESRFSRHYEDCLRTRAGTFSDKKLRVSAMADFIEEAEKECLNQGAAQVLNESL